MSVADFTAKERMRFRKLLEVAHSTNFPGEREAALNAAQRLAEAHGMTLHEVAGLREPEPAKPEPRQPRPKGPAGFAADFGAAGPETMGRWWAARNMRRNMHRAMDEDARRAAAMSDADRAEAEKLKRDEALADAYRRGLDAEERAAAERAAAKKRANPRPGKRSSRTGGPWRSRPEFIRVLLTETGMSAKDIAAVAGVTVYDVFREKLLMRRPTAA